MAHLALSLPRRFHRASHHLGILCTPNFAHSNRGFDGTTLQFMAGTHDGDSFSQPGGPGVSNGGGSRFRGRGHQEGRRAVKARRSNDEYRYWLHARKKPPHTHEKFVVVSYNILAVENAKAHWRELYYHLPTHILHWHNRKRKLLQELGLWSPDIICLQEVDRYGDLDDELQKSGYTGVYKGRTGQATDGCAMFWRQTRFELIEEENIEFRELDLRDNVAQLCVLQTRCRSFKSNDKEDMQATNSGSEESKGKCVVVANIHVLFNPKRGDVKLGQARVLLERAHTLSEKWGKAPVVIAGDFNSTPTSALYRFISSSQLDLAGLDRRQLSGQCTPDDYYRHWTRESCGASPLEVNRCDSNSHSRAGADIELAGAHDRSIISTETSTSAIAVVGEELLATEICETSTLQVFDQRLQLGSPAENGFSARKRTWQWTPEELVAATGSEHLTVVQHNLRLQSSYAEIEGKAGSRDQRGEPLVTTYHRKFMGTVDYIWHTDGLSTTRVLDILPIAILDRSRGLPSQKWGSDHLALACELAFAPDLTLQQATRTR